MNDLRLVIVTPEKTLFDEPVQALRFPLFDGQIGILPGRAPLIGRLGYGELKATTATGEHSYFIDGGFVQVKGPVVSILTGRALAAGAIDSAKADEELQAVLSRVPTTELEFAAKTRDQERARKMLGVAKSTQ